MSLGLLDLLAIGATAFAAATLFWGLALLLGRASKPDANISYPAMAQIAFLLEGDTVIDATPQAMSLLNLPDKKIPTRDCIIAALRDTFPTLGEALDTDLTAPTIIDASDGTAAWLDLKPLKGRIRISVGIPYGAIDTTLKTLQDAREDGELATLREMANHAPIIMWRNDPAGRLVWANDAYLAANDACADVTDGAPKMPCLPLFKDLSDAPVTGTSASRTSLQIRNSAGPRWYDITTHKSDAGTMQYAIDADPIVRAELAQRKFLQTLSQTFAQLSIGLAIFDRRRQLATFNPALFDMTGLPIEFLSSRPSLDSFLDRLRELRMLPEPKDYNTWREQFFPLEKDTQNGTYSESWDLPDGQTFRVTGRPHPDGAFALLFEDISAEISLTRRFRSEIETGQAVLDKIEDAIVVFSNGGNLVLSNAAYNLLWDGDADMGFGNCDLRGELRKWQERCTPSRIWTNLREFTTQMGLRKSWADTAIMDDGRWISCHADPISGGMTMIRFRFQSSQSVTVQKLTQVDPALKMSKR
uniref:PAS-domain containing protein n=1 Tax=Yoonia sp. TaxID=2212373 RepID=UPI00404873D3